ncbi:hypothetical protein GGF46_000015 [Coemansia sp. RSA 552]|nr:hypothetical protein GGF46_000015 [Coemansia sp. RSA 552]
MVGVDTQPAPAVRTPADTRGQQWQGLQRRQREAQFVDRIQAGRQLGRNLSEYAEQADVAVVSVSWGGAVVGWAVAEALGVPHQHYRVRAIPCPAMARLALGSVAGDGSVRIDDLVARSMGLDAENPTVQRQIARIDRRLRRDQGAFRGACEGAALAAQLAGRTLVVVDDAIEAGDTMREAVMHLRHRFSPRRVVVAAPVCLADLRKQLQRHADAVVDIASPLSVGAAARWYGQGSSPTAPERRLLCQMFANASAIGGFAEE